MKRLKHPGPVILALLFTLLLALLPACFDKTQHLSQDGASLLLGLPFAFYNIFRTPANDFAVHFNLGALFADFMVIYGVLRLGMLLAEKWKEVRK